MSSTDDSRSYKGSTHELVWGIFHAFFETHMSSNTSRFYWFKFFSTCYSSSL